MNAEKVYPSKVAVVYPEGSLKLNLAIYAFNELGNALEQNPELAKQIAQEFGVEENEVWGAVEELYTEN